MWHHSAHWYRYYSLKLDFIYEPDEFHFVSNQINVETDIPFLINKNENSKHYLQNSLKTPEEFGVARASWLHRNEHVETHGFLFKCKTFLYACQISFTILLSRTIEINCFGHRHLILSIAKCNLHILLLQQIYFTTIPVSVQDCLFYNWPGYHCLQTKLSLTLSLSTK